LLSLSTLRALEQLQAPFRVERKRGQNLNADRGDLGHLKLTSKQKQNQNTDSHQKSNIQQTAQLNHVPC
jgi:hypothetical protein